MANSWNGEYRKVGSNRNHGCLLTKNVPEINCNTQLNFINRYRKFNNDTDESEMKILAILK